MAAIRRYSGTEKKLKHIPFPVLSGVSYLMLWNAKLTGKYPMITPDWVAKYKYDWALNSSKAVNELGYAIRPLEEGIKETVEWVRRSR
jgi:nucleoside-diphosphate-sugar epimerase